ncbi:MAG: ATP-binding protein [Thermoprotei archaeon]
MVVRVYGGDSGIVLAAPSSETQLGQLFACRVEGRSVILKVIDFSYVSSAEEQFLAEMSKQSEDATPLRLTYSDSVTTLVSKLKPLVEVTSQGVRSYRTNIPPGTQLFEANEKDLEFLQRPNGLPFGKVRSGHNVLDVKVMLDPLKTLSEHLLIAATTGRGKSNLLKTVLWSLMDSGTVGIVVVDPHREYFSELRDHPRVQSSLVSFSPNPAPGEVQLAVSTELIRPSHLEGSVTLSEAQEREADLLARRPPSTGDDGSDGEFKGYGSKWVEALVTGKAIPKGDDIRTSSVVSTRVTLMRKLSRLLSVDENGHYGVFKVPSLRKEREVDGSTFLKQVAEAVDKKKIVLIDSSSISQDAEMLIGNMVCQYLLDQNMRRKQNGESFEPCAIVLEEAPRLLSANSPPNSYMRVAREGRKFGIGLIAVTQLISVIPEDILANMNTKVYFGMASGRERRAAIDNALNDLDGEEDELVRLDVGEAILTNTRLGFAVPIKVPSIEEFKTLTSEVKKVEWLRPGQKLVE